MAKWMTVVGALVLAAVLIIPGTSREVTAEGGGAIVGEVKFVGTPPKPKVLKVNKDTKVCGKAKQSEALVVGSNNGIRWAVVSLADGKGPVAKPKKNPVLDQKGCHFKPHVLLVPAGAKVDVLNPDGVLHNVHSFPTVNRSINKAQPKFKKKMAVRFGKKPEIVKVQCDAHSWMGGWIVLIGHPHYAVTGENGAFRLDNVPSGKHKVEVWHESLGKMTKEVQVKAGAETKVVFKLKKA